MTESWIPRRPCPRCGAEMDKALSVGHERAPNPGDATICAECASWAVFTDDLSLRPMDNTERSELLIRNQDARRAEWAVLEAMNQR